MDEQELNKKLAEWAGFKLKDNPYYSTERLSNGEGGFHLEQVRYQSYWDKDGYAHLKLPSFIQSLDCCIKWLIPKLNELGWGMNFFQAINNEYWKCVLWEWGNPFTTALDHIREDSKDPALALCLAIEKLIDDKKNEN